MAKIGRDNHFNHLVRMLPFITAMFAIQCYLIYKFAPHIPIGDYATYLGITLSVFISMLAYYDNNHHVFIYRDRLHILFSAFGTDREIMFEDIEKILGPEEECPFATLIFKLKDDDRIVLYFVDFPHQTVHLIRQLQKQNIKNKPTQDVA